MCMWPNHKPGVLDLQGAALQLMQRTYPLTRNGIPTWCSAAPERRDSAFPFSLDPSSIPSINWKRVHFHPASRTLRAPGGVWCGSWLQHAQQSSRCRRLQSHRRAQAPWAEVGTIHPRVQRELLWQWRVGEGSSSRSPRGRIIPDHLFLDLNSSRTQQRLWPELQRQASGQAALSIKEPEWFHLVTNISFYKKVIRSWSASLAVHRSPAGCFSEASCGSAHSVEPAPPPGRPPMGHVAAGGVPAQGTLIGSGGADLNLPNSFPVYFSSQQFKNSLYYCPLTKTRVRKIAKS